MTDLVNLINTMHGQFKKNTFIIAFNYEKNKTRIRIFFFRFLTLHSGYVINKIIQYESKNLQLFFFSLKHAYIVQ